MIRRQSFRPLLLAALALSALTVGAMDLSSAQQAQVPTVAILDFRGGGVGRNNADLSALGAAIPHHLGYVLARNPNVRLVDRGRIQEILREQNLSTEGRIDSSTMVRIGRLLSAQYILDGSFIIQDNGQMSISTTSTMTQTSQVSPGIQVRGRIDRVLDLLDTLAVRLNAGLKLAAIPAAAAPSRAPAPASAAVDQNRLILLEGAALKAEDRGDVKGAIEYWKQVTALSPSYEGAKVRLARLGAGGF